MKQFYALAIVVLLILLLASCELGQMLEPTFTPMPTITGETPAIYTPSASIQDFSLTPQPTPGNIIGGGTIKNGPFIFDLRLFRDSSFNQQPVATSLYSDLDGIGEYMYWFYQGNDKIGPVETDWGTLPDLLNGLPSASSPVIEKGSSGGRTGGVLLPGGPFLAGKSSAGDQIQLALKVLTPNGNYDAVLQFTLSQGTNGFEPINISVVNLPTGN